MRSSNILVWLSWLIVVLALVAAGTGLFWQDSGSPYPITTLRGTQAQIYGQGLYHYDSLLIGAGFRGADAIVLFLAIPLLVISILSYRHGSLRGAFWLMGVLACFLYNYASLALGAAYNPLFLIYVALFSASFFAFGLAFTSIDRDSLPGHISTGMPHRGIAIFMVATGLVFLVVWLGLGILLPLTQGQPPQELASYTTLVTHALDLGILMPVSFLTGILLLRRAPLGYLLAFTMLVLAVFVVGASVPAATVSQWWAGYAFTTGQVMAFVIPFVVLGLVALWLAVALLRNISE